MRFTFKRGIHPNGNKSLARDLAFTTMEAPKKVLISMSQHLGAPAKPIVAVGDPVKAGTLIGEASAFMSANVYSSISGKVTAVKPWVNAQGMKVPHIEIENDGLDEKIYFEPIDTSDPTAIIDRIKLAGIVGMGGATFPTHIKLKPSLPVDTLIINGAECEPYITCDYRLMLEKTDDIISGIKLLATALKVSNIYIGIEDNKKEAIDKMLAATPKDWHICPLVTKYPQGAEKQLIHAITKRVVPVGKLPMEVGCVVDNIHTAYSIARACIYGEPCYERALTVSGRGIDHPKNLFVKTGVSYHDLYDYCSDRAYSVEDSRIVKIISGGPMMGFAQPGLNATVGKGSSALLFLTNEEVNNKEISQCINCARCRKVCPMNLMPMMFERANGLKDVELAKKYNIMNCVECGSCSFTCPAGRPIVQSIRLLKKTIREAK